jgi:hypothetical protein
MHENAWETEIAGVCSASAIEVWRAFCLSTRASHNSIELDLAKVRARYPRQGSLSRPGNAFWAIWMRSTKQKWSIESARRYVQRYICRNMGS